MPLPINYCFSFQNLNFEDDNKTKNVKLGSSVYNVNNVVVIERDRNY